jgi:putative oxidoreductase
MQDWMTRLGALLLIPPMLGAIAMVHWPRWAFTPSDTHPMGGMEFQVTLILIMLYLLVKGNSVNREAQPVSA